MQQNITPPNDQAQVEMNLPIGYVHQHDEAFSHLARGDVIACALIDERDEAMHLVDDILQKLTRLNSMMERYCPVRGKAFELLAGDLIESVSRYSEDFTSHREKIRKKIDGRYWLKVIHASRVTTLMNASAKKKMEDSATSDAPEFAFNAVMGTIQTHYESRMATFVEAGLELFESLDRGFKNNDRICLRKKIIFKGALSGDYWNSYGSAKDRVHDLERILMILDGKDPGGLVYKETAPHLLEEAARAGKSEYNHEYFDAKLYNNGNVHLTFTRFDLVDRFNELLANFHGHTLGKRTAKR